MKTIREQIEIMQHFANGGSVEIYNDKKWSDITNSDFKSWNFATFDFRIKKQKETVVIEKWLCKNLTIENNEEFWVCETSNIDSYIQHIDAKKVKLIETYEVEL